MQMERQHGLLFSLNIRASFRAHGQWGSYKNSERHHFVTPLKKPYSHFPRLEADSLSHHVLRHKLSVLFNMVNAVIIVNSRDQRTRRPESWKLATTENRDDDMMMGR